MSDAASSYEDVPGLVDEVFADDPDRAAIHEVPRVDPVVPSEVQLEELALPFGRNLSIARLEIHDAHGANANGMRRALQQPLDLDRSHVHAFAGKAEDLAHADAVVVVGPRRVGRPQCLQPFDELRGGVSH